MRKTLMSDERVERVELVVTSDRAMLFDKLDTAKMHGLDMSKSCRV